MGNCASSSEAQHDEVRIRGRKSPQKGSRRDSESTTSSTDRIEVVVRRATPPATSTTTAAAEAVPEEKSAANAAHSTMEESESFRNPLSCDSALSISGGYDSLDQTEKNLFDRISPLVKTDHGCSSPMALPSMGPSQSEADYNALTRDTTLGSMESSTSRSLIIAQSSYS